MVKIVSTAFPTDHDEIVRKQKYEYKSKLLAKAGLNDIISPNPTPDNSYKTPDVEFLLSSFFKSE